MKNITFFVLTVLLAIGCIGCSFKKNESTDASYATINPSEERPSVDEYRLHFTKVEEIDAFAASSDAPEGFVKYKAISNLGEFDNYFVFLSHYHSYSYSMIDPKMYKLAVDVLHVKFYEPEMLLQKTDSMADMTTTGTDETGAIILGPLMYRYVGGSLRCIAINIDGIQIKLSFTVNADNRIDKYPVDENGNYTTMIERLVFGDEEEALTAADELIAFFRENR